MKVRFFKRIHVPGLIWTTVLIGLLAAMPAAAGIVAGVEQTGATPLPLAVSAQNIRALTLQATTVINFDGTTEPCLFSGTTRLTNEFAAQGVVFSGPGGNDGGAVLDECSGFGVSGQSSPNFLAFNTAATMSDGGVAQGPETLTFTSPVSLVELLAGNKVGGSVSLECFDAGAHSLGSDTITATTTLQAMSVAAPGIASCQLTFTGSQLVVDDLGFSAGPAAAQIPALGTPGTVVLVILLLLAGVAILVKFRL